MNWSRGSSVTLCESEEFALKLKNTEYIFEEMRDSYWFWPECSPQVLDKIDKSKENVLFVIVNTDKNIAEFKKVINLHFKKWSILLLPLVEKDIEKNSKWADELGGKVFSLNFIIF